MLKFGGKVPKLGKLMGALILAGLVQVALDAQDVLTGPAFSIQESGLFGRGLGVGIVISLCA